MFYSFIFCMLSKSSKWHIQTNFNVSQPIFYVDGAVVEFFRNTDSDLTDVRVFASVKIVLRFLTYLSFGERLGIVWVLLLDDAIFLWSVWLSCTEGALVGVWLGFLYFDDGLGGVFWDFFFGRRNSLETPTTLSFMGASDIPAMFRAWQRYSPASSYDNPFSMIIDQRTPTWGDCCITET